MKRRITVPAKVVSILEQLHDIRTNFEEKVWLLAVKLAKEQGEALESVRRHRFNDYFCEAHTQLFGKIQMLEQSIITEMVEGTRQHFEVTRDE